MCRFGKLISAVALVLMIASPTLGATFYAKPAGTGTQTCLSWTNACTLNVAIALAASTPYPNHDTIWVEGGTHVPIEWAGDSNITIIGGFAGTESSASQSDPITNVTTVDGGGVAPCADRSGPTSLTALRGLRFANGFADAYTEDVRGGGALLLINSSPKIVDCVFEYNWASFFGGAVSMRGDSSPEFVNCIFRYNGGSTLDGQTLVGGAIYGESWWGWKAVNCLFHHNRAWDSGAMYVHGDPTILTNCTIADNSGTTVRDGGGVYFEGRLQIRNSILWGNRRIDPSNPNNSFLEQLSGRGLLTVSNSDIQGGWAGTGNIDASPQFEDAGEGDYNLFWSSPCVNSGSNTFLPLDVYDLDWDGLKIKEVLPVDLEGLPRIEEGTVDMGAFEAPPCTNCE